MQKELNILMIEDVPRDAEAIEHELRSADLRFRVRRVETREGFLRELNGSPPDVVLSDFTLPSFDALQALRLLQKHQRDVPFILVTGTRSEEVAVECMHEGADDYILKASLKRLPSSIQNVLEKKAAQRAKASAEAALRRSEEQYRLITESTHDLISLLDEDGKILYASPAFRGGLGCAPEDLMGADFFSYLHPDDAEQLRHVWREGLVHHEGRTAEFRARHRQEEWRNFEAVINWIGDEPGQPRRSLMVSRDITRRKHAEESLRELPRLIREAQETERRRVARDLHDSVNQILSSVKFRIQSVEEKLLDHDEAAWKEATKAKSLLEKAMQEVRRISRNLRPSELDDLGLAAALRSLCGEFSERTGVVIELATARLPQNVPGEIELNLYRIIQEALNNIEKHSRATDVTLRLAREGSFLRATIRDNGRGFDPLLTHHRAGKKNHGMGLVDIKERAAFVGGHCAVQSVPGRGTELAIAIPLNQTESHGKKTLHH